MPDESPKDEAQSAPASEAAQPDKAAALAEAQAVIGAALAQAVPDEGERKAVVESVLPVVAAAPSAVPAPQPAPETTKAALPPDPASSRYERRAANLRDYAERHPEDKDAARMLAVAERAGLTLAEVVQTYEEIENQVHDQAEKAGKRLEEAVAREQVLVALETVSHGQPKLSPADIQSLAKAMARLDETTLVVVSTNYHGPGCPDPQARKFPSDQGFTYDAHHPARPGEFLVGLPAHEVKRLLKTRAFRLATPKDLG